MLSLMCLVGAAWTTASIVASDGIDEAVTFVMLGFVGVPSVTAVLLGAVQVMDHLAATVAA